VGSHQPVDRPERLATRFAAVRRGYALLVALAGIPVLVGALATPGAASIASTRTGATLYSDYCSVCHGDRGDGTSRARASLVPPPRDFTTPAAAAALTRERMLSAVLDGRPGTAMTGWRVQLSEAEIESVVSYIREQIMMPIASEDAAQGRRLYASTCSVCHGDDGRGARWTMTNLYPRPRNFTRPETRQELTRAQMVQTATYGKPDTAMPGFDRQLSRREIESVVDYILSAFVPLAAATPTIARAPNSPSTARGAGAEDEGVDMEAPMSRNLFGDARRGVALYMSNCAVCHGVEGDGQGPRAYFILPKPRNFQHPGSRQTYNRPALFRAIARGSVGSEMPAWDTVLNEQQIADVAEYVFDTFIRYGVAGATAESGAQKTNSAVLDSAPRSLRR